MPDPQTTRQTTRPPVRRASRFLALATLATLATLAATPAAAEYLGNITLDTPRGSFLPHGQPVIVTVDYQIDDPAGRRILVTPYTDGAQTPQHGTAPSGVLPPGTGTVTLSFSVGEGEVLVDAVRVVMRSPDLTETPLEIFVPVSYRYGPHGVFDIQPSTSPHSRLRHGTDLAVTFQYAVDASGCRILARPWNGSSEPAGYTATPAELLPPGGWSSQSFSFDADAGITHIRFLVHDGDTDELLAEFLYPFACRWRTWGLRDIAFDHGDNTSLHHDQPLVSSFVLDHQEPGGLRVVTACIQDGEVVPGNESVPGDLVPAGTTALTRSTRVASGTEAVHAVRFLLGPVEEPLLAFDVPRHVVYGPHAIQDVVFTPAPPAILALGERLEMTFDYVTDAPAGVRVLARAAYEEQVLFGMVGAGSPIYPGPSGSGDFWMLYGQDATANSIRLRMTSGDQAETYLEWFEPGWFIWSGAGTVTGVAGPATDPAAAPAGPAAALGRAYPNPFNPVATIPVTMARAGTARLAVYDPRGRLVRTLHDGPLAAGAHRFTLDGATLGSGTYLVRLRTGTGVATGRMLLVR